MKKLIFLFCFLFAYTASAQVFITEIADPNGSGVSGCRYVELYNAGAASVDLSTGWTLSIFFNANATAGQNISLTGTIAAGDFYIICNNTSAYNGCFTPGTCDQAFGSLSSNGDDNFQLTNDSGIVVDAFGIPGEDGTGTCHEFEDGRVERDATVTAANPTWDETEWNEWSDSTPAASEGCTNYTGSSAVNIGDGLFDPGTWIGAAPPPPSPTTPCFVDAGNFTNYTVTTNSQGDEWFFNGSEYVGNGYCGGGCAEAVEFWLISGRFDYGNATILDLNFNYEENFGNTDLNVVYSTDYTGAGDPNLATWTTLTTLSDADGSAALDISAIPDLSNFYIAFEYVDDGADGYSSWEISNIIIEADDCAPINCLINNLVVSNAMCSGDDFVFDVTFDAANGSGNFNIVDETGATLVTVAAADGTDISTTVTVTGPTTSGQSPTSVAVVDAADVTCTSAVLALPVSDCPVTLFISEISYNPCNDQGSDDDCEFVLISNSGTMDADISGYSIATGFSYTFPAGTIVPAGGNLSLGRDSDCEGFVAFDLAGGWSGNLNNSGETIDLVDDNGATIFSITYDDGTGADGNCDILTGDASGATAPGISFLTPLAIDIADPCSCPDGFFCGGTNFAQEVITITTGTPGETISYIAAQVGVGPTAGPSAGLFGTDGLPLATDGSLTATDNLDGTYTFIGYVPADNAATYVANFEVTSATASAGMKTFIDGGPCPDCVTAVDVCIDQVCQGNALYVIEDGSTDPIDATGITFFWYKDGDMTTPVAVVVGNAYFSPTEPGVYTVMGMTENCIEYNLAAAKVPFEVEEVVNCKDCP